MQRAVIETTSHALDQARVAWVDYNVSVGHPRTPRLACLGDFVITCGKAHEQSMCYGTSETPWDEFAVVRAGLAARGLI